MSISISLNELENSGLIRQAQLEPELEYIFRHALVQDASYESLLKADRRVLHANVAQILEKLYPTRLDELAATLAEHYDKAENYPKALEYYLNAGKTAAKVYANTEASVLFSRAIELVFIPESQSNTELASDAFSQYGRVLELLGNYEAAIENYRQMQAEAIRRRERGMEMGALIAQAITQATPSPVHNISQAEALCEQALVIANAIQDREAESRIYWILLLANYFGQDSRKSVEYGKKSLEIARAINNRERMAFTLNDIARSYYGIGDLENANAAILEAQSLWEQIGNIPMLADNLSSYSEGKLLIGDFPEAIELAQRAYTISKKINNAWGQGFALSILAIAYWQTGETETALQKIEKTKELFPKNELPFAAIMNAALLMEINAEMGMHEKAANVLELLSGAMGEILEVFSGYYELLQAYAASVRGDLEFANSAYRIARQEIKQINFGSFIPLYMSLVEVRLAFAEKKYTNVIERVAYNLQFLNQAGVEILNPQLMYWRGKALIQMGQLDDARTELTSALDLSERIETRHTTWRIHADLATVSVQQADSQAEAFHRQSASEIIHYIADHAPEELKNSYLNQPEIRAILSSL